MAGNLVQFDLQFQKKYSNIVGLDEAGRGAWAGPVVAAAAIMPLDDPIAGINDSKKLTPKKRDVLFDEIKTKALCYGIGMIDSVEIDAINILEASKKAMLIALGQLSVEPGFLLVDGNMTLDTDFAQQFVIEGDAKSYSIAAASILAKVTRDRLMCDLSKTYPDYAFESHKGYGTKKHQEALKAHGCLDIHRKSYKPIAKIISS
jgi:ribonuclease HII